MNNKSIKKIEAICKIVIGALSIIFAIIILAADSGVFERQTSYGGDAYTGIQNAGAITANNVKCLAIICSQGFGFILLVGGALITLSGITAFIPMHKDNTSSPKATHAPLENGNQTEQKNEALETNTEKTPSTNEQQSKVESNTQKDAGTESADE